MILFKKLKKRQHSMWKEGGGMTLLHGRVWFSLVVFPMPKPN